MSPLKGLRKTAIGRTLVAAVVTGVIPCVGIADDSEVEEDAELQHVESEDVVVTGTRRETSLSDAPIATEVITRVQIENSGAEDVSQLLEEHPGIVLTRSFLGAEISIQGLEPEHILILVDSERLLGAKDGVVDLSRFSLENIERIEIVKGANSALYGSDAMGGVVNIITRDGEGEAYAQLRGRYGSLQSYDLSVVSAYDTGPISGQVSAGYHVTDGYDLDPSDEATTGSAIQSFDVSNRLKVDFNPNFWVGNSISYLRRDLQRVDNSSSGAVFDTKNSIEDFRVSVRPSWLPDSSSRLSSYALFSLYRDQYLVNQRGGDSLDSYQETKEYLGQGALQYDRLIGEAHFLSIGVDLSAQLMESDRLSGGSGQRSQFAFFVQDEWSLMGEARTLVVLPGLRLDLDTWYGSNASPKLAVRLDPTETTVVRASYGLGYRAPGFKELLLNFENPSVGYVVEGNPELTPETSESVQLSVEVEPSSNYWLSISGFYNDIENLIGIGTLGGGGAGEPIQYGYVNIASAMTRGGEAVANLSLLDLFRLRLSYTLTDSLDKDEDRPLEGRALHSGTVQLQIEPNSLEFDASMRARIVGERYFYLNQTEAGAEAGTVADPYVAMDLRVSKELSGDVQIFGGVDNLLNAGDVSLLTIPPRFIYAGLTARFGTNELSNGDVL